MSGGVDHRSIAVKRVPMRPPLNLQGGARVILDMFLIAIIRFSFVISIDVCQKQSLIAFGRPLAFKCQASWLSIKSWHGRFQQGRRRASFSLSCVRKEASQHTHDD